MRLLTTIINYIETLETEKQSIKNLQFIETTVVGTDQINLWIHIPL